MKPGLKILLSAIALLSCAIMLITCNSSHNAENESVLNSYTQLADQFKAEKLALAMRYKNEIAILSQRNNDLRDETDRSKHSLAVYRFKAKLLEAQLKGAIENNDTAKTLTLFQSYFEIKVQTDSACDSTIHSLENIVVNRDSVIAIQDSSLVNMRDLQKEQEIQTRLLTTELNTAYKVQKRTELKTRLVAFGSIFIAGATTAIVIIKQKLK